MSIDKTFKILPRVTASGAIVSMSSYHGYANIEAVIHRIKTDSLCLYRSTLLAAIEQGQYWESL